MGRKFRHNGSTNTKIGRGTTFKYDTSGNLSQITGTVDTTTDDIIFTGTKSNLRRIADLERNVSILASQDRGDGGSATGKQFGGKVKFKNQIEVDGTLKADGDVDVAGTLDVQAGLTLGATAQEVVQDLIGGMANTGLSYDDANNQINVDTSTIATQSYADTAAQTAADAVVAAAPGSLDTLNELAAALGDDANFATTVTDSIATKAAHARTITAGNGLSGGGDLSADRTIAMDGSYTGDFTVSGDITANGGDMTATRFNGEATTAKYADLAERYEADAEYDEGTVMMFGGEAEVTAAEGHGCDRLAGVVSMKPAYLMNGEAGSDITHPAIALQGRVPVKTMGAVKKGDIMVAADNKGHATAWKEDHDPKMTAYIGIAIKDKIEEGEGMVEVKVGK